MSLPAERYVLAGPETVTPRQLVRAVGAALGVRARAVALPDAAVRVAAALCRILGSTAVVSDQLQRLREPKPVSIAAAQRDLGFAPQSLAEALRSPRGSS
jgi:nucleoside-diphosphate-sugar epimerase